MAGRFDVSYKEWAVIEPLLPNKPRGVPRVDDRRVLNGIFWVLRTGAPWKDIPERYGPRTTAYNRFVRWRKAGVWERLVQHLQMDIDKSLYLFYSTAVRVHQHGTGARKKGDLSDEEIGRSRGGLTTKVRAVTDRDGRVAALKLTPG
jgi:transposase